LSLYEEGVALVKIASARLEDAERRINVLKLSADGEPVKEPFDTAGVL
jgi:exonuclease VII small subunit